jgi:hypothetical protein
MMMGWAHWNNSPAFLYLSASVGENMMPLNVGTLANYTLFHKLIIGELLAEFWGDW